MNKEEIKIVPALRFPEFVEEWKIDKLGNLAKNFSNKRIPITSNKREKGDIPYYGATGVIDYVKDFIFDEELLLISEDGANLLDRNYPIAYSISGKTWVNNHAHVLKFKNKSTEILIEKYINSNNVEEYLTGKAQPKLNKNNLERIIIPLPPNPKEQQKIAACLSSLDEIITAETEKLDLLQDHKKGLLQQLFPAEGETQPKYRFPEFKDDGDWEEKELKKLLKFQTGYPFSSKGFNDENKGIRLIKNRDLKADDRIVFFEGSFDNSYLVDDGDILVGMDGDFSPVKWNKEKALLNQRVGRIKTKNNTDDFFFYFLSIHLKIIEYNTPSTTVKHLSHSTVEKLMIPIPPTKEEQQKIAQCLSAADALIEAQTQKIKALQEHKKGLLQQLFPDVNEVAV